MFLFLRNRIMSSCGSEKQNLQPMTHCSNILSITMVALSSQSNISLQNKQQNFKAKLEKNKNDMMPMLVQNIRQLLLRKKLFTCK